jgi:uncharacterized membrane protein
MVAASVALCVRSPNAAWLTEFVRTNNLAYPDRLKILSSMAVAFAVAVAAGAIFGWRRGVPRLRRIARRVAPLAIVGLLPPLFVPEAWNPLDAALAIGGVVFLAERLLRMSFEAGMETSGASPQSTLQGRFARLGALGARLGALIPRSVGRWAPVTFVLVGAVGYGIYMSVHTLWMHQRFQTYGYDLGQYDNVFWSTLHGYPLRDAPLGLSENWSELRNHADLSTFFFLPFYAIKPGAPALLVIQSCVLGLGAIPLYRFASRHLPRSYACVIALAYLLYPPMHGLQFYDFHFQPIASTFVLFVVDFIDEKRYLPCAIAFVVAIGCREDVSIGLAILGAFLTMSGYRPRAGVVMGVVASAYFVTMRFVIMPKFGPTYFNYVYRDLMPEGAQNVGGVLMTLISNPAYALSTLATSDKLRYALQILVPLALLPLRRGYLAVSVIHGSILTLLSTRYAPTIDIGFQYSANFIPYIFPASVLAMQAYGENAVPRRRAALCALVTGTLLCGVFWDAIPPRKSFKGGFELIPMTRPTDADRKKQKDLDELHAMVPSSATLAVSEREMPHLSHLKMITLRDSTDAEYFLYGVGSGYFGSTNADRLVAAGEVEKLAERPGLILLRRKQLMLDAANLAARAHWRASSAYPYEGSAQTGIGEHWPVAGHNIFFHTREENSPWIEFDLGKEAVVHRFEVVNRGDCCQERAVPLVVEIGTDAAHWVEVANRTQVFSTWSEDFAPQSARYVRFRVPRETVLHFASVDVR